MLACLALYGLALADSASTDFAAPRLAAAHYASSLHVRSGWVLAGSTKAGFHVADSESSEVGALQFVEVGLVPVQSVQVCAVFAVYDFLVLHEFVGSALVVLVYAEDEVMGLVTAAPLPARDAAVD